MSSAWVHVSKARTSSATRVGRTATPPVDRLVEAGLTAGASSVSVASAAASNSATACAGGRPAWRARACAVRPSLSVAVSGMPGTGTPSWSASSDSLADEVDDDVVDGPAGELGRVDRAGPVVDRQVAQQQDRPRHLDAVDIDRRGAGDHRGRAAAAARLGEHAGPQLGGWRDVADDRGGELAGRGPQVLLPAGGVGTGVEVGGDVGGVVGVVGVEGVGGQIVR